MILHPQISAPLARKDRLGRHRLYSRATLAGTAPGRRGGGWARERAGHGAHKMEIPGDTAPVPRYWGLFAGNTPLANCDRNRKPFLQIFCGPSARRTRPATTTTTTTTTTMAVVAELRAVDPLQLLAPPAGPTPSPPCPCQLDDDEEFRPNEDPDLHSAGRARPPRAGSWVAPRSGAAGAS